MCCEEPRRNSSPATHVDEDVTGSEVALPEDEVDHLQRVVRPELCVSVGNPGETIHQIRAVLLLTSPNFYIAFIGAAIVSFVIGGIWYARPVFGKAWMSALGKTEAEMETMRKHAAKGFAAGLVGSLIGSFVLSLFLEDARLANVGLPGGLPEAS